MKTIFTVLQDIEKLIYKILMWIILIPKTVVRIVWEPRWAAEYIRSELRQGDSHFDEYVSPVILLLVVALLPSLGYNALPKFGVALSSPAVTSPTTDRFLSFDATADFKSSSPDVDYYVAWEIWKKDRNSGEFKFESSDYHDWTDANSALVQVDNNTIQDRFRYTFATGEYLVYASAGNADTSRADVPPLESYEAYLNVLVPDDPGAQVQVSSEVVNTLEEKTAASSKNFLDRVKEEQTIFLALALMFPPLLFAFASQLVKRRNIEGIGEESLRESFYVQCYYFSPLSLAIWGTYYAYYFFTANAYWYVEFNTALQFLLLPLVWAVLWFIRTEVKRIAWELQVTDEPAPVKPVRKGDPKTEAADPAVPAKEPSEPVVVSRRNTLISSVIVLVCIGVLVLGGNVLLGFKTYMDDLRLFAIRAFPSIALLLIVGFVVSWFRRRQQRNEEFIGWNVAGLVVLTLAFVLMMNRINGLANFAVPPVIVAEAQATNEWIPAATLELVQAQPTLTFAPTASPVVLQATDTPFLLPATPTLAVAGSQNPEDTSTPTETATPEPTVTPEPTSTQTPTPTQALARSYVEEFNSAEGFTGWVNFMTFGDTRMVKQTVNAGKLSIAIRPLEDKYAWYYLINDNFSYGNVRVEAVVTNQGNNANGVSLICRYSNAGWYEFVLSSSGNYSIYAVDNQGAVNQGYNLIANGGSARIKTGRQTNVYTATCAGNELTLLINGTEVRRITDTRFQFTEGKIGLAVSSMQKLPVNVDFDLLSVSEP